MKCALRGSLTLALLLTASCATVPVSPRPVQVQTMSSQVVRLTFSPERPREELGPLRGEELREALTLLHEAFPEAPTGRPRRVLTTGSAPLPTGAWEERLWQQFLSRYGSPLVPLPQALETSPLMIALRLSPHYMAPGVREAAEQLFSSPVFLSSVALSVAMYFAAWLLPEPLFSKAFVATLTLRLALLVGALELRRVALTCVRLYQEARAARTLEEVEAAAEHFGRALGGTGLRVLVMVASMGVAKGLPQVPGGGLATLLKGVRYVTPEGLTLESTLSVQMMADGTVVLTGTAAGTAATSLGSACADGSEKKDGYQWHHIATNKNESSAAQGGPWTPLFRNLFAKAGMDLDAAENLVYLKSHKGPHPEAYHLEVYEALRDALQGCGPVPQCKSRLTEMLRRIASATCTPGSTLHGLLTMSQE